MGIRVLARNPERKVITIDIFIYSYSATMDAKQEKNTSLLSLKTVIRTKDYKSSKDFYTRILDLKIIEEFKHDEGCILRFGDESSNAFLEISSITKNDNYFQDAFAEDLQSDKIDIQIRTDSVDYWAERLQSFNWKARGPIPRPWGSRYLYLRDPDNLQIIIYEEK